MRQLQRVILRYQHTARGPWINRLPDFAKYSYLKPVSEGLALYLYDALKPFPTGSKHVNPQHYYHNKTVLVDDYAKRSAHPVSLTQLAQILDDSKRLTEKQVIGSGRFVKEELAIRLALKLNELQQLPFCVVSNYHLAQVYESYYDIFERIRKFPTIRTLDDNTRFCEFLKALYTEFNTLNLPHLIMGSLECTILDLYPIQRTDELLSSLLRARISRRLIVEEHLSLTSNYMSGKRKNTLILGDIFKLCSAREYIEDAIRTCGNFIKNMYYETIPLPEVIIEGEVDLQLYFLPSHMRYLLGELLRNVFEATVMKMIREGLPQPDPIVITLAKNPDYYIFKISDRAGGLMHDCTNIWSFGKNKERATESLRNFHRLIGKKSTSVYEHLYSKHHSRDELGHARPYMKTSLGATSNFDISTGNLGFSSSLIELLERPSRFKLGVGLAMCKVYADYWNGDLTLHSMPGYGCDTVLTLGNLMKHTKRLQLDRV